MNNVAIFNWMLPHAQSTRRTLLEAQRDEMIYRYAFALTVKHRMSVWMMSFPVSDWEYLYPLSFIQAWGATAGLTVTTHPTGQGTELVFADDLAKVKTKPIPSVDASCNELYQYPAGAVADPCEAEFEGQEIESALNQLISDLLHPYRRALKQIAFGNEFYRGIFGSKVVDNKIDYAINQETTPWMIYNRVRSAMVEFESLLAELMKTGDSHATAND